MTTPHLLRKRKASGEPDIRPSKYRKSSEVSTVKHPLLNHLYGRLSSLKDYLIQHAALKSKTRRRRVEAFCRLDIVTSAYFDEIVVGSNPAIQQDDLEARVNELHKFTQSQRQRYEHSPSGKTCSLTELFEFIVWTLFERCDIASTRPSHLLCNGLRRSIAKGSSRGGSWTPFTTGIEQDSTTSNVTRFTRSPWLELHALLGSDGEAILVDLFLHCALFRKIHAGENNYQQLSGIPIHEREGGITSMSRETGPTSPLSKVSRRWLSTIHLARNRTLYAIPDICKSGEVRFGLGHCHALNRHSDLTCVDHDLTVLKYIFPRQCGLHNVFEQHHSFHFRRQTTKDYTYREAEIRLSQGKKVPPRLRGLPIKLIRMIRRNHVRLQYAQLLAHYCQVPVSANIVSRVKATRASWSQSTTTTFQTQPDVFEGFQETGPLNLSEGNPIETSLLPFATPSMSVAAFCMAALHHILPRDTFGRGQDGIHNCRTVSKNVYKFVIGRRAESLSVHELVQGLKITAIPWLIPPHVKLDQKLSMSDERKRSEILHEMIYYVFDSLLIPLVATNFYVTESGIHKNKLLYFRQDVWQRLSKPHIGALVSTTLSSIPRSQNSRLIDSALGVGTLRLVPKEKGCRPIANLQQTTVNVANGRKVVHASINTKLQPVFNIFNFERAHAKDLFRIHSFSSQDVHRRLSAFQAQICTLNRRKLYFVKTDIQSAYDSIPQPRLLSIVDKIFRHDKYINNTRVTGRLEIGVGDLVARPHFAYRKLARAAGGIQSTSGHNWTVPPSVHNVVCAELDRKHDMSAKEARDLLYNHVSNNLIKVAGKIYHQAEGIPQGSKLSSLLCTFFYNHFEKHKLQFLSESESILLRVIDDFLLITTDQRQANRFLQALEDGDQEYGITVHPDKSLVNFDAIYHGKHIPKLSATSSFPYCGLLIDTHTLQVSKDRAAKHNAVSNTLSVDSNGRVAHTFLKRMIGALKNQLLPILLDTQLNGSQQVTQSLTECFQITTMKMHQYFIILPTKKRPSQHILIEMIRHMIGLAQRMVRRHGCSWDYWTHGRVSCVASVAIASVLEGKNTHYARVLVWLKALQDDTQHFVQAKVLTKVVNTGLRSLSHLRY